MVMSKQEFSEVMKDWLENYLKKGYSKEYDITVVIPGSNLSKIAIGQIKKVKNYSSFEFAPDILGILTHKFKNEIRLVFMNRSINAISLKEIGEIHCYSKIAEPFLSFIVSLKGLPSEVNLLLLNSKTEKRLLNYSDDKHVIIFRWDETLKKVDKKSIFPISKRNMDLSKG